MPRRNPLSCYVIPDSVKSLLGQVPFSFLLGVKVSAECSQCGEKDGNCRQKDEKFETLARPLSQCRGRANMDLVRTLSSLR